jgi:signal transduction histidine kinase
MAASPFPPCYTLAVHRAHPDPESEVSDPASPSRSSPADLLIAAVQDLSFARDLSTLMKIACRSARELTGADGAAFVLRDQDTCHHAEEEAIAPLWKGRHLPMSACISGWAMDNRKSAAIEDVCCDERIPGDAYRQTFVKSLVVVPIRTAAPVGAISGYWASPHRAAPEEIKLLQALADSASTAMENMRVYGELEALVRERTAELEAANRELESFSYSVSHDLRAPLRAIDGFTQMLQERVGSLDEKGKGFLVRIRGAAIRMNQLIEDLSHLARITREPMRRETVDLTSMARDIAYDLGLAGAPRRADIEIADGLQAHGDARLLRTALENLLSNAWKYTAKQTEARIRVGASRGAAGERIYFIGDNGAGFDMAYAGRLFGTFQRLHGDKEFSGNGVGLATVQRIIAKHGGRIWAEAEVGKGATFFFTLG